MDIVWNGKMIPNLKTNGNGNKENLMIVDLQVQFKRFMSMLNIQEINNGYSIYLKKSSTSKFIAIFM